MAIPVESRSQNAISAEDWQGVQLGAQTSANSFTNVREQGLDTDVRVKGALRYKHLGFAGSHDQKMDGWTYSFENTNLGLLH